MTLCGALVDRLGVRDERFSKRLWSELELPPESDGLGLCSGVCGIRGGEAPLRLSSLVIASDLGFRSTRDGAGLAVCSSLERGNLLGFMSGTNCPPSSKAFFILALSRLRFQIPMTMSHDIAHRAKSIFALNFKSSGCRSEEMVKRDMRGIGIAAKEKFQTDMDNSATSSKIERL